MKALKEYQNIFFMGVGGIGMSALARYFRHEGKSVSGYDKTATTLTRTLESEGIKITYEDKISPEIEALDVENTLVIYTPAIKESVILDGLKSKHFSIKKRAEILGEITQNTKGIAVAGTHGKTTTSALVAHLVNECGMSYACFLGGISENLQSNFHYTGGEYSVMEADEFDRSFLHLRPQYAIITSTDADHLDIYGTEAEIKKGFSDFADLVPAEHLLVRKGIGISQAKNTYAVNDASADFYSTDLRLNGDQIEFTYHHRKEEIPFSWSIPGVHNVENATAAIALMKLLGAKNETLQKALASFKGIKRRYTKHIFGEKIYIDDYAHHPTELRAVMDSIRTFYPEKKLLVVFQPHLYSRTRDFAEDFAKVLSTADELILMEIYPAREKQEDFEGVSSSWLAGLCTKEVKVENLDTALEAIKQKDFDILLTVGAGNIDTLYAPLVEYFRKNEE